MKYRLKAFTIIEVMVVVVVVGILSTAALAGFSSYLKTTNDSNRSSQVNVIAESLEKYYDENGEYPTCSAMTQTPSVISSNTLIGIKTAVFQAPGGSANSIVCNVVTNSNQFGYVLADSTTCVDSTSCVSYSLQYKEEATGLIKTITSRRNLALLASPPLSSNYISNDSLFCRYAADCSGISGISSDFSYQVTFTAKASSKYLINMVQIDNTSTSWITGTTISSNITYSTPTAGASLASNIITTTNAGDTRVTFTGTGFRDKTTFARITEVDNTGKTISSSALTRALGVYTTVGSYTMSIPTSSAPFDILVVGSGGNGGGEKGGGGSGGSSAVGYINNIVAGSYAVTIGSVGSTTTVSFPTPIARLGSAAGTSPYATITYNAGGGGGSGCCCDCCGGGSGSGGLLSSITGVSLGYCGGGGGGSWGCTNGAPANYQIAGGVGVNGGGGGGTGGSGNLQSGGNGGSGIRGGGGGGAGAYAYTGGTGSSGIVIFRLK